MRGLLIELDRPSLPSTILTSNPRLEAQEIDNFNSVFNRLDLAKSSVVLAVYLLASNALNASQVASTYDLMANIGGYTHINGEMSGKPID